MSPISLEQCTVHFIVLLEIYLLSRGHRKIAVNKHITILDALFALTFSFSS